MNLVRAIVLILSTMGFWEMFRHRFRVHVSFLPSMTVSLQVCLLLAGGLLYRLPETVWLLGLLGLSGFIYYFFLEKGKNLSCYFRMEYLFLILGLVILFFCVQGRVYTHYDNFSHWAQVLKKMMKYNHFPDREMTVLFPNYPLGSTVFVYYVTKWIGGGGESVQMLAQAYVMLTCIMPIFQLNRKNNWMNFLLVTAAGSFMLSYNVQVSELLVDTLLPLVGMCVVFFVYAYRNQTVQTAPVVVMYLIWLLQIKNAGIFFALIPGCMYLYYTRKNQKLRWGVCLMAAALGSLMIWNWHYTRVNPQAAGSEHSLSMSWWTAALQDKSMEDIKHIILSLVRFAFGWQDLWLFAILLGCAGVCCVFVFKEYRTLYKKVAVFSVGIYLTYQVGLMLMYIFSMLRKEAFHLSSVDRYEKTILIAMYYILTALAVKICAEKINQGREKREKERPFSTGLALTLCIGFSFVLWKTHSPWSPVDYQPYQMASYNGLEVRMWMENLKDEYELPEDGDYTILISEWDSDYFWHLGMYLFPESDIQVIGDITEENLEGIRAKQVMIYDTENPLIQAWVRRYYPEQEGKMLINR